jgi:Protein of unknown function (DUF3060)
MPNAADRLLAAPLLITLTLLTGCQTDRVRPLVNVNDGRQHFTQDRATATATCDGRPFVVDADRVSLRIGGPCRQIVIAGDHNDIEVSMLPGGVVEITGAHNDVTWRQMGRGPRPVLSDRGQSNSFHRGAREDDAQ